MRGLKGKLEHQCQAKMSPRVTSLASQATLARLASLIVMWARSSRATVIGRSLLTSLADLEDTMSSVRLTITRRTKLRSVRMTLTSLSMTHLMDQFPKVVEAKDKVVAKLMCLSRVKVLAAVVRQLSRLALALLKTSVRRSARTSLKMTKVI